MQWPSRPTFQFLSRFRCHFPVCHKELQAVLLNNTNDILLSPVPVFQPICIWGPPNGNKWHICIHLPHRPCDLSDIKRAFLITQWRTVFELLFFYWLGSADLTLAEAEYNQQMSTVGSSGIQDVGYNLFWSIRKYLVLQTGIYSTSGKAKSATAKGARCFISCLQANLGMQALDLLSHLPPLTVHSFDISWRMAIFCFRQMV